MLTVGSLFSGIGGLELGLERAGMKTVWQVEKDDFARRVLAKHWPYVPKHDDVKTFPVGDPEEWACDLICGGFPCQDISNAGRRAGIDGERSGLWSEYIRIVRIIRPRYVVVENVAALLIRGMDRVLGDLAESGYDAEWDCLPAGAFGAPHVRDRVFILAHSRCQLQPPMRRQCATSQESNHRGPNDRRRDNKNNRQVSIRISRQDPPILPDASSSAAKQLRWQRCHENSETQWHLYWKKGESLTSRVANGVPARMDRLRTLGNAVVPQVAEFIGRLIIEHATR